MMPSRFSWSINIEINMLSWYGCSDFILQCTDIFSVPGLFWLPPTSVGYSQSSVLVIQQIHIYTLFWLQQTNAFIH